jgi:gliding motility-associated-like protein
MRLIIAIVAFAVYSFTSYGQSLHVDFDNCNIATSYGNGTVAGAAGCECGINGDGMYLDGNDDALIFPDSVRKLFTNDYTIDFYIDSDNIGIGEVDIFSIASSCDFDSLLTLKHFVGTDEIVLEIFGYDTEFYTIKGKLPKECWNRITITKTGLNYTLYINNVEIGTKIAAYAIPFGRKAKISFANSPCLTVTDERFVGRIDEISFYNRSLSRRELAANYLAPEKLLARDTTIYAGSSVPLKYGSTCASNFSWSPASGLSSTTSSQTIATPAQTTTYKVISSDKGCTTVNDVTIYVVDPANIACDNILLPGAFTPNGDNVNYVYAISNYFIIDQLKNFEVLDRWGEVVYHSSIKEDGWDGKYKGAIAAPNTYAYRVNYVCRGKEYQKMGSFVLLK